MSTVIENGKTYVNGKLLQRNILIEDGKIAKISSSKIRADEKINASRKIVVPGFIDPHVHFREPGLAHKENFLTGSIAAAAGGNTCVLDMPNTKPPTLTLKDLEKKRELAKKSVVNFGFHFGSSEGSMEDIKKAKGISSVKIFMDATTGNMLIENEDIIREIIGSTRICSLHAERRNLLRAATIGKSVGRKIYVCHVSSANEISHVTKNRSSVFCEATPHHMFLTKNDSNNFIRMKPELKDDKDRKALWKAFNSGLIDTIGTDHAPHTIEEKESDEPPYGVPGVETRVPLFMNAVLNRRTTLKRVIEAMCENPAIIFKIKNKGFIKKGFDADITIIDTKISKKVRNDKLFTKCGWSPFDGYELQGWPEKTIVNGNIVFDDGTFVDKFRGKGVEYYDK